MLDCFTQTKSRKEPKGKTDSYKKLWQSPAPTPAVKPKNILAARPDELGDYIMMPTYLSDDTQSHHHDLITTLKEKFNIKTEPLTSDDTQTILHDYIYKRGDVQPDATLGLLGLLNEYGNLGCDAVTKENITKENITKLISAYRMVMRDDADITELEKQTYIPFFFLHDNQEETPHYMSGVLHKISETECDLFLSDPMKTTDLKYSFHTGIDKSHSDVLAILKNMDYHADNQTRRIITGEMQTNFGEPSEEIPDRPVQQNLKCGFESVLRMMDNAEANIRKFLPEDKKTESVPVSPVKKDTVIRMLKACMRFAE